MEQERGISVSTAAMQFLYQGHVMNLLDTPGHQDFSEDTYRTLMAVDSAIMLLDGARGVEPQTIKLFKICRERGIPIFTFINKMDLPARNPFELLDEVESVLGIAAVPLAWPMGSGKDFRGFYDLEKDEVHLFEKTEHSGAYVAPESVSGLEDDRLQDLMDEHTYNFFREGVEISQGVLPPFDREKFLRGEMTPVFFGSAVTNFGVAHMLDRFLDFAPAPSPIPLENGETISPEDDHFSAFVFKLQANMNRQHRDRVAFVRITSGVFERGMTVDVPRLKKGVKLTSPVSFFGQERATIDEAFPGDIIGLINPGLYRIGDVLYTGTAPDFHPLPRFAPDLFSRIVLSDTSKQKQFRKGLTELAEEGVVQVFNLDDQTPIVGAVGQLQFEVFQFRLEDEYGAPIRLEGLNFEASRWISDEDIEKVGRFEKIVRDDKGNAVVLFETTYRIESFQANNTDVELRIHPP